MEDQELIALKKTREKLITKVYGLLHKLKEQEDNQQVVTLNVSNAAENVNDKQEKLPTEYEHRLCEISGQISGITFENTDKKWLHDNIYKYTTNLMSKSLNIYVELTVKLENEKEFEICDITCNFVNIEKCYLSEIEPWVQTMTRMKNFSFLTSAISQYSEQSIVRIKILNKLEAAKYVRYEKYTDKNGGLLIHLHSPESVEHTYLTFVWSVLFVEHTWKIDHCFVIESTETGVKFAEENQSLLNKFCKPGIGKEELINLWTELCSAIDLYEDRDQLEGEYDTES